MKSNKWFVNGLLLFVLLCFISCGLLLNQENPENSSKLASALGIHYTGGSSTTTITPTTGMTLVTGGTFSMGSTSGDNDETPVHSVTLASFYMCDHEVTQAEFSEIMGTNPSHYSS
ncbi:MAG: SUMF1/EgtB/PvdO family nonheme iron enzyme, partial [Treponemataceae bacterium]|nr:SUMF1/EgtB/PvdO family nonheme iron enzyme [Treponemataceae bacterium]